MKIGTTLFLLPFLILAEVGAFGYLIKDNQDLREQVAKCDQSVSVQVEKSAELQRQIDQYVAILVTKEKELIQAKKDVQDKDIQLMQKTYELRIVTDQLEQAKTQLDQLNDQAYNQPVSLQRPAQAAFTPTDARLIVIILGGLLIILVAILGHKQFSLTRQTPRFSQVVKQTRRGQIVMTMSDQTYQEFQSYLKSRQ
jgi:hypothetical protein